MTWFKVDDGFYSHEKVLTIPRAVRAVALGTWIVCGTWSADKDRDGVVPAHMVEELGGTLEGAASLVAAKLWKRRKDGFVFVNWSEFQPTREEKAAKRIAESQRKAEYRARKARENAGVSADVPTGQDQDDAPPVPDPTRTRPEREERTSSEVLSAPKARSNRGSRIPEPFIVTGDMRAWAASEVPGANVDAITRRFVDYWRGESGVKASKVDWVAAWRNWLRRAHDENGPGHGRPLTRTEQNMAVVAQVAAAEANEQKGIPA
jgi:hypothetical protein